MASKCVLLNRLKSSRSNIGCSNDLGKVCLCVVVVCVCLYVIGPHVANDGLELLISCLCLPPGGVIGMCHHTQPRVQFETITGSLKRNAMAHLELACLISSLIF